MRRLRPWIPLAIGFTVSSIVGAIALLELIVAAFEANGDTAGPGAGDDNVHLALALFAVWGVGLVITWRLRPRSREELPPPPPDDPPT